MKRRYTLIVFAENYFGILNRITIVFSRRRINIDSLTVSETERKGISRFTIVVQMEEDAVEKVIKQLRKIIGVLVAFHNEDEEVFFNQIALYKVAAPDVNTRNKITELAHSHQAKTAYSNEEYVIIEKTGKEEDISTVLNLFEPYGVLEFVKSGRIAVAKDQNKMNEHMLGIDVPHSYKVAEHM